MAAKKRHGEVRCLNCFTRFDVSKDAEKAMCPECKLEWRISWPTAETAKIRGPVWDKMPK